MFMISYNQYKQKIKHNKIQLKQELWPIYEQWKAFSHLWVKRETKVIQVMSK